jgi:diguanylate cyclase (GGDEF)-like protein
MATSLKKPMETQVNKRSWVSVTKSSKTDLLHDLTECEHTEKALKQRIRELTLLNHLNNLLQVCHTEEDTYEVVSSICKKLFPGDSGCLGIMDHARTKMKVVDFWGQSPTGVPIVHDEDAHAANLGDSSVTDRLNIKSLCPHRSVCLDHDCLCVPIRIGGDVLGVLSLCFKAREADNSDGTRLRTMKLKRMILAQVAEHYALSLVNLRLREALRMEAIRDPLTELYNRRYMEESLEREAYRAKRHHTPIGIILFDIDYFKSFNDTYGHEGGDMILQELGAFLQKHVRGEDIACRYGGDEFLLILPETTLDVSRKRAEELRLDMKDLRIPYSNHVLTITVSIGLSVLLNNGTDVKTALAAADKALYQAKKNGRDQVVIALP